MKAKRNERNKEKIEFYGWKKIYGEKEVALVKNRFCKIFRCKAEDIKKFNIVKCSIDARKKQEIYYNYCIEVELPTKIETNILPIMVSEETILPTSNNAANGPYLLKPSKRLFIASRALLITGPLMMDI